MSRGLTRDEKVLIVLLGSVGDVARGLSVAWCIKTALPDITLGWVVEPKSKDLVINHPSIDKVFLFQRERGIVGFLEVIKEVRAFGFTLVLDLQRHLKSGLLTFLSGAPRRIGFHRRDSKEFNWLFQTETIAKEPKEISKTSHYLKFIEKLGLALPQKIEFGLKEKAKQSAALSLPKNYIVMVLGSSWESKDWPISGYERLAQMVLESGQAEVVLVGGKDQELSAKRVSAVSERVMNLVGKTSLADLFPIISGATLCVGPDSGPAHIAGALGVRYITLFGPTDPRRVVAFGSEDLALRSEVPCSPCWRRVCPGLDKVCMRLIAPESVWSVVRAELVRSS